MKTPVPRPSGSAVIVVLALLGILSLYILANARTLSRMKHEVKQVEQRQLQHWASPAHSSTNSLSSKSPPPTKLGD